MSKKIVHLVDREGSHAGSDVNSGSPSAAEVKRKNHAKRFRKRLIRRRHLQQYFLGDTLFRTMNLRSIAKDELFLDLIIVANSTFVFGVCDPYFWPLRVCLTSFPSIIHFYILIFF